jgi:hypothetical protein
MTLPTGGIRVDVTVTVLPDSEQAVGVFSAEGVDVELFAAEPLRGLTTPDWSL